MCVLYLHVFSDSDVYVYVHIVYMYILLYTSVEEEEEEDDGTKNKIITQNGYGNQCTYTVLRLEHNTEKVQSYIVRRDH